MLRILLWLSMGLTIVAGVLVSVDIFRHAIQGQLWETLPSYALLSLVGAVDVILIYIGLTRRAS